MGSWRLENVKKYAFSFTNKYSRQNMETPQKKEKKSELNNIYIL